MIAAAVLLARTVGSSQSIGCACTGVSDALGHGHACKQWADDARRWCYVQKPPMCPSAQQQKYGSHWWWTTDCDPNASLVKPPPVVRVTKLPTHHTKSHKLKESKQASELALLLKTVLVPEGGCRCSKELKDFTGSGGYCKKVT